MRLKGPAIAIIRNRIPVILAIFLIEFMFSLVVIVFFLLCYAGASSTRSMVKITG